MIKAQEFYKNENEKIMGSYEKSLEIIKEIASETEGYESQGELKEYYKFFDHAAKWVLKLAEIEKRCDEEYFGKSFDALMEENHTLFNELVGDNYNSSYANPAYSVSLFGEDMGKLVSAFYAKLREYIGYSFKHRVFDMEEINKLFIEAYNFVKYDGVEYDGLKNIITRTDEASLIRNISCRIEERSNKDFGFYKETIMEADLNDPKYLFRLGKYITQNEVKTAEFLKKYPKDKISKLSKTVVEGFKRGFIVDNKDR
jgi:hypothetical protein